MPVAAILAGLGVAWSARKLVLDQTTPDWGWLTYAGLAIALDGLVVITGGWLSGQFYDVSWDGQAYQQVAVIRLAEGWNPLHDLPAPPITPNFDSATLNYYAKGPWIIAAALYRLTGQLEQAKAFNLILAAATFGLVYAAVSLLGGSARRRWFWLWALALGGLAAANPVIVCQAFTFYVDGQLACLLTSLVALLMLCIRRPVLPLLLGLASCLALTVNAKATGVGLAAVLGVGALIWIAVFPASTQQRRNLLVRVGLTAAIAGAVGVLLLGYQPYVTNTLSHGNPFYPLAGPVARDIMTPQMPRNFRGRNGIEKMTLSLLSRSGNVGRAEETHLKLPFTVSRAELREFNAPDVRVGGWGPLFGGALLVAAVLLALAAGLHSPGLYLILALMGWMLLAVFLIPEAWWARYAPHMWLVPCVAVGIGLTESRPGRGPLWLRRGAVLLLLILALNVTLVAGFNLRAQQRSTQAVRAGLAEAATLAQPLVTYFHFAPTAMLFTGQGMRFTTVPQPEALPCPQPLVIAPLQAQVCPKP